jgi:YD repeat-containing protein
MLDAGSLVQGNHTIYVRAQAYNGTFSEWAYGVFTIDNTPVVTVLSPGQVEGGFDFNGTVEFKERTGGEEGSVTIWIDGLAGTQNRGTRHYEGTTVDWSYSQIAGQMLDAGSWLQGNHTIYVRAQAFNGTFSEWAYGTFEVTQLSLAKYLGDGCGPCETRPRTTNPINFAVGNKYLKEVDLVLEGPGLSIGYKRYYNSKSNRKDSPGYGWSASFSERVATATGKVIFSQADGAEIHFADNGQGKYISETDQGRVIESVSGGGKRLIEPDGKVLIFNSSGQLTQMVDRNGNTLSLAYSSGKLSSAQDNFGRVLQFTYNIEGRLRTLNSPVGQFTYAYDSLGNLISVMNPELKARTYLYEDPRDTHNLTGIINERGIRSATIAYDAQDRAVLSEGPGGINRVETTYENNFVRKVKDSLGRTSSLKLFLSKGIGRVKSVTGVGCGSCLGSQGKEYELSGKLLIMKETDARGTATLYTHDDQGNVLTKKEAAGSPYERTVTYSYHPSYNLITSITKQSIANPAQAAVTTFTYDSNGNVLSVRGAGYARTDPVSRVTTYAYNSFGQLTQMDGPRTDVADITFFEYYPNDTIYGLNRGMLKRIVDAPGHEITFGGYNPYGKPTEIRDSNDVVTSLTYDGMGRLIFRTVGGRTASFEYDETGNLLRTILANGLEIVNTYAPSGLLERIEDNAGHYIQYFYDPEGNPIRRDS